MSDCTDYDPDNIFKRFRLVDFPLSFVELYTIRNLDVEVDLNTCAYLKTMCDGQLMKFEDARAISASHRAFHLKHIDNTTIQIKFYPKNECIATAKLQKMTEERFVFDLRLLRVNDVRCCNNELHAEIGRYYISGTYVFSQFKHFPKVLNFGLVAINSKVSTNLRIRNESSIIAGRFQFVKVIGIRVQPENFTVLPQSSKRLLVTFKPTSLVGGLLLSFRIRNPDDMSTDDENYITYTVGCKADVFVSKTPIVKTIDSLHKLYDRLPIYTYLNKEKITHEKRQAIALKQYNVGKSLHVKPPKMEHEKFSSGKDKCHLPHSGTKLHHFCKLDTKKIGIYDLINVYFHPFYIDFGNVAISTHGKKELNLNNNTKYSISIKLQADDNIVYTDLLLPDFNVRLPPFNNTSIIIYCFGYVKGRYDGSFNYVIDDHYSRKYPYYLKVGDPKLNLPEKGLKFGMVTTEGFVTSVPVRIYNDFNVAVDYEWSDINVDTPFEITPSSGTVLSNSCKLCDVSYTCKATKTKTHEVDFISKSTTTCISTIELNLMTRKLSVKFLQPGVMFKEIPLNLKTRKTIKLENSSREIALFYVQEPLIPGFSIEPMSGTMKPKTVMVFYITVKIPCVLEFAFDVFLRINNKENIVLPVSGNVVEPKIVINPKNIYMARIPSFMVTYVPVTFQNAGKIKSLIQVTDSFDRHVQENMFNVYIANGNEKVPIREFTVEAGQSKTVYIKVCDENRREYEMFMPFQINGLLGPPNLDSNSTELGYYVSQYKEQYENNLKVKLMPVNKEISYCRILGVITLPWVKFSTEKFEFTFDPNLENNSMEFTITNISKYYLYITILTSKLSPHFGLELLSSHNNVNVNETNIKFDFEQGCVSKFLLKFHPKGHGKFTSTAVMFLDKQMSIPYYNLTFVGRRKAPNMIPSTYRVMFPPCEPSTSRSVTITIDLAVAASIDEFGHVHPQYLSIKYTDLEIKKRKDVVHSILTVKLAVECDINFTGLVPILFNHNSGACCEVQVYFCITSCILTLHANKYTSYENNPYPYYPDSSQQILYEYFETCVKFLEMWLFQQGFRRDLYPAIPETFQAIAIGLSSQGNKTGKGMHVSFLNFVKRIAGPLMKHIRKASFYGIDDHFKQIKEIHDTYKEVLYLLKIRGANISAIQPAFLLSHDEYCFYSENVTQKCNADIIETQLLTSNADLFNRLNKQCWIDFVLQCYKVFIVDSCFFECVCVSKNQRDVIKILVDWYNKHISIQHKKLRKENLPVKVISNITTDLSDGIALASVISYHCPFLDKHFSPFCEVHEETKQADIINNTCLIIEAINILRLFFPLTCKDMFEPNFIQMLFLSIHLFIVLPMLMPKEKISFEPPLLRTSTRQVTIYPSTQETLTYNFNILNNNHNTFIVEKCQAAENGKKIHLNVTYVGNFVKKDSAVLVVQGYNKTRIYDTYVVFLLEGTVGILNPIRKCKVVGTLYRPNKVDVLVTSPFPVTSNFTVHITDVEPMIPLVLEKDDKPQFCIHRLNLIEKEVTLNAMPKDVASDVADYKLYLQLICLSTQTLNSWIWFISDIGQFFIKVTTLVRWDLPIDSLQARVQSWPMDPCSCGEACECYRTTLLLIPHRNELMLRALRYALLENASSVMMHIFDQLIESSTGKIILSMLLEEGGTNMSDVNHILRRDISYKITSKGLTPQQDRVSMAHHTDAVLALPVTVPANNKSDKFTITLTSACGMDVRTYRIFFVKSESQLSG